ncbi:hypothetical protein QE152_g40769 [Popillia japonica]|uniref:Uncharacterized protein n=1 Tax=Popillia japonica TaxID=7064 RepID=A0AAW1HFD0_POPJA
MKRLHIFFIFYGYLLIGADSDSFTNTTRKFEGGSPPNLIEDGIWGSLLEDLVISSNTNREKRILKLIPINNGFVADDRLSITEMKEPKESKVIPGKIINKPTPAPAQSSKPPRQVSETDLYLLNAIEKLVFRMDFMEKRLRKVEEMLYYVMAGNRIDRG